MHNKIKVFHLEDYKIMRDGIRRLLSGDEQIEVVGEAKTGDELFSALEKTATDVVLMDLYLDGMNEIRTADGFEICNLLQRKFPKIKIVAHSIYDDADSVARIIRAGATAFISKKAGYEELLVAIKSAYAGKRYICRETSGKLKNLTAFLEGIADTLKPEYGFLSAREKSVLQLLAKGYSSREIAKTLFITEKTVETHRRNMARKANVKNTVELVAYASAKGLLKG
ncbi:MAG: response regulator transcription factor [Chitinophagaceae bacterium]